jgi:putative acetyltransferase
VVGHVALSPVTISNGCADWYGLGPVWVLPEHQRRDIGGALIREGMARLKALCARGCCVVGHPEYYGRFGFKNTVGLAVEGVPPEVFFALSWDGHVPQGLVEFHEAFSTVGET